MQSDRVKTILVTGGTGFTGSHLARRMLLRGYTVRIVDSQKGLFARDLEESGATVTIGSVTDRDLMDRLVAGCHVVHHVAAAFRSLSDSNDVYWDVNVNGTRYLLEAAIRHGVEKFVYCSTQGVHGDVKEPPASEESPIAPADYYQFSKYEGEKVAHEFIAQGLNVTILRPTAIYGPGDPGRWLMLFKRTAHGRFLMFGDGRTAYHPLYIDNLVDAFELAMEREAARGQTYLIGDDEYYTLNEIVRLVGEAQNLNVSVIRLPFWPLYLAAVLCEVVCAPLRVSPPLFRRRVDWFRQVRAFDLSKAQRELGYRSRINLREGLARTAAWYKTHGYLK